MLPGFLIVCMGLSNGPAYSIVKDEVGAYTFTDNWGNPRKEIVYSWDLHTVEKEFDRYIRNTISKGYRHTYTWRKVK
jgi:capsule polysaccharide export protein KpsC/LpsZ